MALFDSQRERSESVSGDAATRALSVTVVENDFVARVYENLASVYDLVFGPTLHPGRIEAIQKMKIRPGDSGSVPASTCRCTRRPAPSPGSICRRRCSKRPRIGS
jgi:hypothetical protein